MSSTRSAAKPVRCPICGKDTADAYKPFCSKRCADIDLARWFTGNYAIAGRDDDEGDGPPRESSQEPENDSGDKG